jgi:hypothetical protein
MAVTAAQFQAWLEQDTNIKCTLVEVEVNIAGVSTMLYISNRTFNTTALDTPSNLPYLPILKNSLAYTEKLPIDGTANLSYGDISIDNTDGTYDAWMNYVWANMPISIYMGDPGWPRNDFVQIYTGLVADISFSDRTTINLSIRSVVQKLNATLNQSKVGGTSEAKDLLRPLLFGEVHNITPLQTNPANLEYMVHNGPIERIIEVRDNGVPLAAGTGYTADLTSGTFRLLNAPVGTITCSVQGEQATVNLATGNIVSGTWSFTTARIIALIIKKYSNNVVNNSEIDLQAFSDFDLQHRQAVGVYITQETNIISLCQELASSVGAQFTSTRAGKITLLKIDVPVSDFGSPDINDSFIVRNTLTVLEKVPVKATIKLGYVKNWTVQTQLLTGIPEEHKVMYAKDYYYATADDASVRVLYKLPAEPAPVNTLLVRNSNSEVTLEATRRLNLWKTPRYVFRLDCIPRYLTVKLGDMVNLTHYRYGLANTKAGQVVGTQIDWFTGKVSLEVMV